MSPVTIIDKYYPEDNERKHILLVHSRLVAEKLDCFVYQRFFQQYRFFFV